MISKELIKYVKLPSIEYVLPFVRSLFARRFWDHLCNSRLWASRLLFSRQLLCVFLEHVVARSSDSRHFYHCWKKRNLYSDRISSHKWKWIKWYRIKQSFKEHFSTRIKDIILGLLRSQVKHKKNLRIN